MNISYSSLSQLHGELSIDLDKSDFQPKISEELKKLKKKAQVKGFRAGHVPESLIKSMYGSTVKSETLSIK
jgi:trigger factor